MLIGFILYEKTFRIYYFTNKRGQVIFCIPFISIKLKIYIKCLSDCPIISPGRLEEVNARLRLISRQSPLC